MSIVIKDWRTLPAGREKYQLYLASREWAVLRGLVRARSGGTCERCRAAPGEQVHHQTYERIYREGLDDLVHLCRPCHEFVSGGRGRDPMLDVPVKLFGATIRTVYLAGKITGTTWRDEIAPGWSFNNESPMDHCDAVMDGEWGIVDDCIPLPDGRTLDLTGPFWRDVWGGHGCVDNNDAPHACGEPSDLHHGELYTLRTPVASLVRYSISTSDMVFAWIDSEDCFGTLAEIGLAVGMGKIAVVASSTWITESELWLAAHFAHARLDGQPSAAEAWRRFWPPHNAAGGT